MPRCGFERSSLTIMDPAIPAPTMSTFLLFALGLLRSLKTYTSRNANRTPPIINMVNMPSIKGIELGNPVGSKAVGFRIPKKSANLFLIFF